MGRAPQRPSRNLEQPGTGLRGAIGGYGKLCTAVLSVGLAWVLASGLLIRPGLLASQQRKDKPGKIKERSFDWAPPQVDTPLHNLSSSPPCEISRVIEQAGTQANALFDSLQSFSAREEIRYKASDHMGYALDSQVGTFDYVVVFKQDAGGLSVQESRNPEHGSRLSPAFSQDVGFAGMALVFLPEMRNDYEMRCEGTTERDGQPTWVVHFQQREDRPGRSLSFRGKDAVYPAKLKGRAWISAESGEVRHIEMSLMDEIPEALVRHWYLSINYAPVEFRTQHGRLWLPQTVDAYCDFEEYRTISYHTFTNFKRFLVQTGEVADQPKTP